MLLLKDADERLESSNKEKEDVTFKLLHAEKVAAEWKNRVSKVEEDNAKVRRVLEQSMTRLNRMSMESDYLVDRYTNFDFIYILFDSPVRIRCADAVMKPKIFLQAYCYQIAGYILSEKS